MAGFPHSLSLGDLQIKCALFTTKKMPISSLATHKMSRETHAGYYLTCALSPITRIVCVKSGPSHISMTPPLSPYYVLSDTSANALLPMCCQNKGSLMGTQETIVMMMHKKEGAPAHPLLAEPALPV